MNDVELAEEILKQWMEQGPSAPTNGDLVEHDRIDVELLEHLVEFTIAALRRGPERCVYPEECKHYGYCIKPLDHDNPPPCERPPSGEMVMVPREQLLKFKAQFERHVQASDHVNDMVEEINVMLSAAEAEGRKG